MKVNLIIVALVILQFFGCSHKNEDDKLREESVAAQSDFLKHSDLPELKVKQIEVDAGIDIKLEITNKVGETSLINIMGNPAESINIQDSFYTEFCNKKAFVVVVRQWINMYESGGWFYYNVVVDTKQGHLIKVIETGEEEIIANGEVILIGQQIVIDALKSENQTKVLCAPSKYD